MEGRENNDRRKKKKADEAWQVRVHYACGSLRLKFQLQSRGGKDRHGEWRQMPDRGRGGGEGGGGVGGVARMVRLGKLPAVIQPTGWKKSFSEESLRPALTEVKQPHRGFDMHVQDIIMDRQKKKKHSKKTTKLNTKKNNSKENIRSLSLKKKGIHWRSSNTHQVFIEESIVEDLTVELLLSVLIRRLIAWREAINAGGEEAVMSTMVAARGGGCAKSTPGTWALVTIRSRQTSSSRRPGSRDDHRSPNEEEAIRQLVCIHGKCAAPFQCANKSK